jgi:GNAT superfamily N-acetyltransferase
VEIALLRQRDPDQLFAAGRRCIARDAWVQHCGQGREMVLVASRPIGIAHQVVGTIELHEEPVGNDSDRRGMLDRLFVLPEQRRQGIGTHLVRAAIAFARENRLAALRETIPSILAYDQGAAAWSPHIPAGEALGGLRSLGATLNACAAERQPCRVVAATRQRMAHGGRAGTGPGRIGAVLDIPLGPASPRAEQDPQPAVPIALATLLTSLAHRAGVTLACGGTEAS